MTIYFAASIRAGRDDQPIYGEIIKLLRSYGRVLDEHVGDPVIDDFGENQSPRDIYERDLSWIIQSDCLVAEVSTPSLGVGYEIGVASYAERKPVLCIHRPKEGRTLSAMITGCSWINTESYSIVEDLPPIFDRFFSQLKRK